MKVKTSLLILLLIYELSVFIRYSFYFTETYAFMLYLSQYIGSIIYFQICYFIIKKAAHYVEDNEKIRKLMRIVIYVILVVFATMIIYSSVDYLLNN